MPLPALCFLELDASDVFAWRQPGNSGSPSPVPPTIVSPPFTHIAHPALIGKPAQGVDAG